MVRYFRKSCSFQMTVFDRLYAAGLTQSEQSDLTDPVIHLTELSYPELTQKGLDEGLRYVSEHPVIPRCSNLHTSEANYGLPLENDAVVLLP